MPPEASTIEARSEAMVVTVTGAARLLGVHPNTVRAWTDQGRLRCHRINHRGDRRYRVSDLERFLAESEPAPTRTPVFPKPSAWPAARSIAPVRVPASTTTPE